MRRISLQFFTLLAVLFLFAFSCQDHVVPEEPVDTEIVINTLTIESPINEDYGIAKLGLQIEKVGKQTIKEFGIAFSLHFKGSDDFTTMPTIADNRFRFDGQATVGKHYEVDQTPEPEEIVSMFYRAYAELDNGKVIYGEVFEFIPDNIAALKLIDLSGKTGPIIAKINVFDVGSIEVEEYGVVYSYKVNANDPITLNPTIADKKVVSNVPIKMGSQNLTLTIPGNAVNEIRARSFTKFKNGKVYYNNLSVR